MTDFVDGSGLWEIGYDSGPTPPPTPIPVDDGDGVTIPGLPPGFLISTTAYERRRSRLDDLPNPWVAILRWLRRIDETREWTADYWRQIELDDLEIIELTANSRNRSH